MTLGQVDVKRARTPREEYDYLRARLDRIGSLFPSGDSFCRICAVGRLYIQTLKKLAALLDSEGYRE